MLLNGLKKGLVIPYDDNLIEKLRNVYYGGIPASVILLSNGMTNGHCYDRALLLSRAFLDEEDDINLLYASIDSIRLNPEYMSDDPMYADHCFVERITKNGYRAIYDTSSGFVYDKDYYWKMQHPKVRHINNKESIKKFVEEEDECHPDEIESGKYIAPLVLKMIEKTFGRPNEMYSLVEINGEKMLQREIEQYKKVIKYDEVCKEIKDDMDRMYGRKR